MLMLPQICNHLIFWHKSWNYLSIQAIQLGPTEASRYWLYWVPAQYTTAIKDAILGKWQYFWRKLNHQHGNHHLIQILFSYIFWCKICWEKIKTLLVDVTLLYSERNADVCTDMVNTNKNVTCFIHVRGCSKDADIHTLYWNQNVHDVQWHVIFNLRDN